MANDHDVPLTVKLTARYVSGTPQPWQTLTERVWALIATHPDVKVVHEDGKITAYVFDVTSVARTEIGA